ncbi:unnamed protein product [Chondrus crispus]|uniref:Uncharacterized protein n=1 Tax=Chondrus crispus TaxID=2769 RepID=R7QJN8_CHOCR|nr:unnamed protein product [Chondrus crispus]CDF38309.1 unnamed protein product [Chondrus crispus]|eukprot:XP_005718194.1 unnamed protein product [Chondrus crispus]
MALTAFPSPFHTVPFAYLTRLFAQGTLCPSRTYATDVQRKQWRGVGDFRHSLRTVRRHIFILISCTLNRYGAVGR